ncbi:protein tipe [Lasius niger]|uniref:Protein tipe n=1 Tax=Lasius niger TaxID=67767 RepID=A0A0J7KMV6_LASNI|nr:protein tipe [Lasius niger]
MADEKEKQTFLQKLLFYTTAFFILLSTFSLFAFLFLVPFVIDPAFTTIFMEFDTRPVECITIDVESRIGEQSAPLIHPFVLVVNPRCMLCTL